MRKRGTQAAHREEDVALSVGLKGRGASAWEVAWRRLCDRNATVLRGRSTEVRPWGAGHARCDPDW